MSQTVTPMQVEARLISLSKEIDTVQVELNEAEKQYFTIKGQYEIALAKSRRALAGAKSGEGKSLTATEKEDMALIANEDLHLQMLSAEIVVRACRGNAARIKTQVDITRSIGSSVRSSMELS
jgi:hypothetical protein